MPDFREYARDRREEVNAVLEGLIPPPETPPVPIYQAVRHSLFAGGKRLRPILILAACDLASDGSAAAAAKAMNAACAIEMVHTYSLIHDDLPSMDNDAFRRGVPTCHKVFGEAMAILAGDALLTMAFEVLARIEPAELSRRLAAELSRSAGPRGMVGGQVRDIVAEGRPATVETVEAIHREKTAALIRAAVVMGALCGGAGPATLDAVGKYGERIGLAFQIADDVLDVTQSTEELGKTAGKDITEAKATYPAAAGLEEAKRTAAELADEAVAELAAFGEKGHLFRQLARFVVERTS